MSSHRGSKGPTVKELVERLGHRDWLERARAAGALARRGRRNAQAVDALSEALASARVVVRSLAAQVLGRLGPRARAALPALVGALRDRAPAVRRQAAAALGRIDPLVAFLAQRRAAREGKRGVCSLADLAARPAALRGGHPRRAA
ncbi:MAG TPA: HEAT repeat domain-containing protein [Gemmataceae bacterium]|nr:HEAT repeat domain-containing protein [Gemmataceae bacterium]